MNNNYDVINYIIDKTAKLQVDLICKGEELSSDEYADKKNKIDILEDLYIELSNEFGYTEHLNNFIKSDEFKIYFDKLIHDFAKRFM